jgi:hypothetical protein
LPDAVDVAPGTHKVEARQGARSAASTVSVLAGKVASTTLSLAEAGAVAPSAAAIPVPVEPGAPETAGAGRPAAGEGTEPTPSTRPTAPKAGAGLTTSPSGGSGFFRWVATSPFAWISLGVTGAGLTVFTVAGLAARQANNNVDTVAAAIRDQAATDKLGANVCGNPQAASKYAKACGVLKDDISKRDTDVTIATVGAIAAGVGVAATITAYFLSPRKGEQGGRSAPVVAPVLGPSTAGLTVVGRF